VSEEFALQAAGPSPHWSPFPRRLKGLIRARGIRIVDAAPIGNPGPVLIPWDRLMIEQSFARPVAADGTPLPCNRRQVIVPFRSMRAGAIARRAQRRLLIASWKRGSLDLVESIGPTRGDRIASVCMAIGGWGLWLWWMVAIIVPAWRNVPTFPPAYQTLAHAAALGGTLLYIPLVLIVTVLALNMARSPNVLLRLNATELMVIRGNHTKAHRWGFLRRVRPGPLGLELEFDDATVLRLYKPRRAGIILRHWAASTGDDRCATSGQISRALRVRICLWFLIGGFVGAVLVYYLQGQGLGGPRSPLATFLFLGVGFPTLLFGQAALRAWMYRRFERRFRWSAWLRPQPKGPPPPP
jgi:hypothetical protein